MDGKLLLLVFCSVVSYLGMATCTKEGELESIYLADREVSLPARAQIAADGGRYTAKKQGSDRTLSSLVNSIIHVPEKTGRNPSFVFQPQRFGREAQRTSDYGTEARIHSRGWDIIPPQFWSMTVPQRFGKKK
ncbi:pro-FMRFamide-related neuropeptide FF like [Pristis pectinata]|uniref:pro-FMRFamide-related neuropeptide FF like n=1 Tax=Pristis pectinata TaxID=685728 RepID=UPI00223D3453|nr:pro-FMRFamide-related neuropeptide FF like [Pristis pectinata]